MSTHSQNQRSESSRRSSALPSMAVYRSGQLSYSCFGEYTSADTICDDIDIDGTILDYVNISRSQNDSLTVFVITRSS